MFPHNSTPCNMQYCQNCIHAVTQGIDSIPIPMPVLFIVTRNSRAHSCAALSDACILPVSVFKRVFLPAKRNDQYWSSKGSRADPANSYVTIINYLSTVFARCVSNLSHWIHVFDHGLFSGQSPVKFVIRLCLL